ncbi:MAG TPA: hypothetical protein VGW96_00045, partial [Candidatus Eremiobacteraceae bacterium]|nr:hypothetical protein [Candidatus Eremiobacteraceae bacterium]
GAGAGAAAGAGVGAARDTLASWPKQRCARSRRKVRGVGATSLIRRYLRQSTGIAVQHARRSTR